MTGLLTALQFLTAIPISAKHSEDKDMARSIVYFPIVGLSIGLIAALCAKTMMALDINEFAINGLLVVILIIITGGLHLDGLADTFDALVSGKTRDEMLNIMRDPHIGTMGVLALASTLLLKFSFLFCVEAQAKGAVLVLMCVLSRWSMVAAMAAFPYARKEGKARLFFEGTDRVKLILATLFTVAIAAAIFGMRGIVIFAAVAIAAYIFGRIVSRKIGGMTGDTLGAMSELTEIVALFGICALKGVLP
jgi:adenosylcobinamide-GDP ribazoletransferase